MSEPDWLPAALDRLEDVGLMEARDYLAAAPGRLVLLEGMAQALEVWIANGPYAGNFMPADRLVRLVAEHRGETPEATLARLRPGQTTNLAWEISPDRFPTVAPVATYDLRRLIYGESPPE